MDVFNIRTNRIERIPKKPIPKNVFVMGQNKLPIIGSTNNFITDSTSNTQTIYDSRRYNLAPFSDNITLKQLANVTNTHGIPLGKIPLDQIPNDAIRDTNGSFVRDRNNNFVLKNPNLPAITNFDISEHTINSQHQVEFKNKNKHVKLSIIGAPVVDSNNQEMTYENSELINAFYLEGSNRPVFDRYGNYARDDVAVDTNGVPLLDKNGYFVNERDVPSNAIVDYKNDPFSTKYSHEISIHKPSIYDYAIQRNSRGQFIYEMKNNKLTPKYLPRYITSKGELIPEFAKRTIQNVPIKDDNGNYLIMENEYKNNNDSRYIRNLYGEIAFDQYGNALKLQSNPNPPIETYKSPIKTPLSQFTQTPNTTSSKSSSDFEVEKSPISNTFPIENVKNKTISPLEKDTTLPYLPETPQENTFELTQTNTDIPVLSKRNLNINQATEEFFNQFKTQPPTNKRRNSSIETTIPSYNKRQSVEPVTTPNVYENKKTKNRPSLTDNPSENLITTEGSPLKNNFQLRLPPINDTISRITKFNTKSSKNQKISVKNPTVILDNPKQATEKLRIFEGLKDVYTLITQKHPSNKLKNFSPENLKKIIDDLKTLGFNVEIV